jgi:hypothetical protein
MQDNTNTGEMQVCNHVPSEIRTHDSSVREVEVYVIDDEVIVMDMLKRALTDSLSENINILKGEQPHC